MQQLATQTTTSTTSSTVLYSEYVRTYVCTSTVHVVLLEQVVQVQYCEERLGSPGGFIIYLKWVFWEDLEFELCNLSITKDLKILVASFSILFL
jgi:hypothetical protein